MSTANTGQLQEARRAAGKASIEIPAMYSGTSLCAAPIATGFRIGLIHGDDSGVSDCFSEEQAEKFAKLLTADVEARKVTPPEQPPPTPAQPEEMTGGDRIGIADMGGHCNLHIAPMEGGFRVIMSSAEPMNTSIRGNFSTRQIADMTGYLLQKLRGHTEELSKSPYARVIAKEYVEPSYRDDYELVELARAVTRKWGTRPVEVKVYRYSTSDEGSWGVSIEPVDSTTSIHTTHGNCGTAIRMALDALSMLKV